ncbi:DUF3108 domain-containing protein [Pedobacter insulae]|nr:hypothetical protein [Pedobacter insulae]
MNIKKSLLLILLAFSMSLKAQKFDTLEINSSNVNANALREGSHRYLVYFKMKKDSVRTETQFWTRTIKRSNYNGKPVLEINQEWEDKDSILHIVKSVSDAKTLQPLYHSTWWKINGRTGPLKKVSVTTVDFVKNTVEHNGKLLTASEAEPQSKAIYRGYQSALGKYFLNWHTDLEIFPVLPFKQGLFFTIPFYDPGTTYGYEKVVYQVTGSAFLKGYNDQNIDCWLLEHQSKGNKEVFWISKKTREVLKLEQEVSGQFYRYKIKLGFLP